MPFIEPESMSTPRRVPAQRSGFVIVYMFAGLLLCGLCVVIYSLIESGWLARLGG